MTCLATTRACYTMVLAGAEEDAYNPHLMGNRGIFGCTRACIGRIWLYPEFTVICAYGMCTGHYTWCLGQDGHATCVRAQTGAEQRLEQVQEDAYNPHLIGACVWGGHG